MPRGVYQRKKGRTTASAPDSAPRARPRDVRDMNRQELQDYALEVGLLRRNLSLPDDRLRQNIQAMLQERMEE